MPAIIIDPQQHIIGTDHFKKMSQELRIASPADKPFRVIAGAFYQRQTNHIHQDYQVDNLATELSVNGYPGTLVADPAEARRQGLCAVRRSELRHHAADHADRRRPLLQVRQYAVRFLRLRPRTRADSRQPSTAGKLADRVTSASRRWNASRRIRGADSLRRPAIVDRKPVHQRRPCSRTAKSMPVRSKDQRLHPSPECAVEAAGRSDVLRDLVAAASGRAASTAAPTCRPMPPTS